MPLIDRRRALCLSALLLVACKSKLDGEEHFGATEGYTCPEAAGTGGECATVEDACEHGDFSCTCIRACEAIDDPDCENPNAPPSWACFYQRAELEQLSESSFTIDCAAGTISGVGSYALDNVDGHAAIDVSPDSYSLTLDADGLPQRTCELCANGCDTPTVTVEAGATGSLDWSLEPTTCPQVPQLCDYCGGTVTLSMYRHLAGDGLSASGFVLYTDIPVVCP
jgi:hypothetical protein